jgi:hypothetical protein
VSISKYNGEGYDDPTAYQALKNIEAETRLASGYRPLIYICSPFAGDVEHNVQRARVYSRFAVDQGMLPITPHLFFPQFMDDNDQDSRALGLYMGHILLTKCKELWYFGVRISDGMLGEINKARLRGIIVRHFTDECKEVPSR